MSTDNLNITLYQPFKRGDTEVSSVSLRRPNSGELRGLSLSEVLQLDVNALHKLLPRISSPALTEHEISQLDPSDLVQISGAMTGFFLPKDTSGSPAE